MLGVFDPIRSNMMIFHLRYSLCLNVFGLMHIAACEGVDGYCVCACVYANGKQAIKIELLKCRGCLIRWFIHIWYGDVRKGPCGPTCDERCLRKRHKERCVFLFFFCFPAGASGQNSSAAHRSPVVSQTVYCSKRVSQRGGRYFQFSGIVRKQPGCFQVAHPLSCLSELQPSDIFCKCHRLGCDVLSGGLPIFFFFLCLLKFTSQKSYEIKAAIGALPPSPPALIVFISLPALSWIIFFIFFFFTSKLSPSFAVTLFCSNCSFSS